MTRCSTESSFARNLCLMCSVSPLSTSRSLIKKSMIRELLIQQKPPAQPCLESRSSTSLKRDRKPERTPTITSVCIQHCTITAQSTFSECGVHERKLSKPIGFTTVVTTLITCGKALRSPSDRTLMMRMATLRRKSTSTAASTTGQIWLIKRTLFKS